MTGFDKEKAAFTVDGSESGRREQVSNDLESGSSISKPGLRVKGAAERRALDEARAGRLAAESFPLWRLVYGEEPGGGTPPGGGE